MQKLTYKTLAQSSFFEIPKIKGSRFLATLFPVSEKAVIEEHLAAINKQYYDARHNCYARRLGVKASQDLFGNWVLAPVQERANDDWEPSNTAGKPILSVLSGAELFEVLVVVTRYFGGTLLGVGGLIQAYTQSAQAGVANCTIIEKEITKNLNIDLGYDQLSQIQYLLGKYQAKIVDENYGDRIQQTISINLAFYETFQKELIDRQISFQG